MSYNDFVEKYKFPVGATVLIFYQLFSAMANFCFILTFPIYMATIMKFSDTAATTIYHARSGMSYFLQIFGAVVSDQILGRINTFLFLYPVDIIIFALMVIMAIYSKFVVIIVMYFLMGIISSLISSGMRAFIGDQIPSDKKVMLGAFLHVIYFINNLGAIVVSFIAPILHKDIYCFDMECYPLIFLVSFVLSMTTYCIVLVGYLCKKFSVYPAVSNLYIRSISCISYGIKRRMFEGRNPEGHWMDYSEKKFDYEFVYDCKVFLGLCIFLIGHPLFWTVFEQLSSVWTLQARYMNGMITQTFNIKADQMQTLNPLLVLIFIPIFELSLYPLFEKVNFKIPFRIALGQFFTAAACGSMIYIQHKIDISQILPLKSTEISVNFFNLHNRPVSIYKDQQTIEIQSFKSHELLFQRNRIVSILIDKINATAGVGDSQRKYFTAAIWTNQNGAVVRYAEIDIQDNGGYSSVRLFIRDSAEEKENVILRGTFGINNNFVLPKVKKDFGAYMTCGVGVYNIIHVGVNETNMGTVTLSPTESLTIFLRDDKRISIHREFVRDIPMIHWQILPYILVTIGEVLFNVNTGIFLYMEAPLSMKSLMLAVQYLCIAIGNWLILIFKQALENVGNVYLFFICGILVFLSGIITISLGVYYLNEKMIRERTLTDKRADKLKRRAVDAQD